MEEVNTESWNKKRIFGALFLIIALLIGGYFVKAKVLGNKVNPFVNNNQNVSKSVRGASEEDKGKNEDASVNIQKAVREKISNLKQEASGLNIVEIASSSPQIQKIINDIKSLEQYPTNQVKEICKKICGL